MGTPVGAHEASREPLAMPALHSGGEESSLHLGVFLMLTIEGHGQKRKSLYLFLGCCQFTPKPMNLGRPQYLTPGCEPLPLGVRHPSTSHRCEVEHKARGWGNLIQAKHGFAQSSPLDHITFSMGAGTAYPQDRISEVHIEIHPHISSISEKLPSLAKSGTLS